MNNYLNQYKKNAKTSNNAGKGTPQPGEIWWVSNLDGIKDRPVLIIGHTNNMYRFRKCTSQSNTNRVRDLIEDYMEAGLEKETYVDREIRTVERNRLTRKMGELSEYDREKFLGTLSMEP